MTNVKTIGIIGGGQLGRMLTLAAKPLGFTVIVLDPNKECPAGQVGAKVIVGDLYDANAILQLAEQSDVVTVEIEHLNTKALEKAETQGTPVHPSPKTIGLIQDKYRQKLALQKINVPVANFIKVDTKADAAEALKRFGGSMILKARHGAYDGRGNAVVKGSHQLDSAWNALGGKNLYAEAIADFKKELSVIIARSTSGQIRVYDVVEMKHERNICLEVIAPAQVTATVVQKAKEVVLRTADILEGAGVFAIEMFLLKDDSILVNEIAPRVHNSGHHTIDAAATSQFEQHIRAVTGLPLGQTTLLRPFAVMVNILGAYNGSHSFDPAPPLAFSGTHIHWYGKSPVKIDRKMGHITVISDTLLVARKNAIQARESIDI